MAESRIVDANAIKRATATLKQAIKHKMSTITKDSDEIIIGEVDGQMMKVTIQAKLGK